MIRAIPSSLVFLFLICFSWCIALDAAPTKSKSPAVSFGIGKVPSWVKPIAPPANAKTDPDNGGISFLLVDQQENLEPRGAYYHEVREITSENGVQNGASITASFDPSYEKLVFHSIRLIRKNVSVNRLERSQIKLFQRERDMERFLYDGAYTAQCELEDVRVGDRIEFAYTIEGANPVKKGKYSKAFATEWSFPVQRAVIRIVYPSQRKLNFLAKHRDIKPSIVPDKGSTEWLADQSDIAARNVDPDTPDDYYPRGLVEISEFGSWEEVANWAVPLFQFNVPLSGDANAEINKLRAVSDPEQRILTALRFVQDEIRYLGIESGVSSQQPNAPSEVLRRRFGDCKDKALLLATLLQRTGIDATPALVSVDYLGTVAQRLPAPEAFDHTILQVRVGPDTYWLDATRTNQRGPLSQIYVRNFGYALVLRPGNQTLTAVSTPPQSVPRKKIVYDFRIPAPPEGSAEFEVKSEYRGLAADRTRSYFREQSREQIEKDYIKYYARQFPEIRSRHPLVYEELPGENACRTTEYYLVPKIWQMNEETKKYKLELYPNEVDQAMGSLVPSQRRDPLALDYPVNVIEEINAEMFEDWPLQPSNQNVANAFFRFRDEAKSQGRYLQYSSFYESLTDRVPVADLPIYNAALTKIRGAIGYTLTYKTPASSVSTWRGPFNWPIALCLVCVLAAAIFFCFRYFRGSKLEAPRPPPLPSSPAPQGLSGWLLLVTFGLIVRPIIFIWMDITLFPSILNLENWRHLTDPGTSAYHPYWAPVLLFELFYNSLCLVFSGLLLALFFRKRAVWPRCFVAFIIVYIVGACFDVYLTKEIPAAAESLKASARGIAMAFVYAAIWIPYAFVSKRVKATFRY